MAAGGAAPGTRVGVTNMALKGNTRVYRCIALAGLRRAPHTKSRGGAAAWPLRSAPGWLVGAPLGAMQALVALRNSRCGLASRQSFGGGGRGGHVGPHLGQCHGRRTFPTAGS